MKRKCPKCHAQLYVAWWRRALSWPLMVFGIVFAIPSVGISLVATLYGVFLRVPGCEACDRRTSRRV